jgi:prepilin-type N-terminal cleavage/methylation domain-containing protein
MRAQRGLTLIELIVVVAVASVLVGITVAYSVPWLAKETMRSGANDVQSFMQLAKVEAVSRNRECRFVIDASSGSLEVWDSLGTDDDSDDVRLHRGALPTSVAFERPDFGDVITLEQIDSSLRFQSVFGSDGVVASGDGAVFLRGGEGFGNVEVYAAGGVEMHRWNGSGWQVGF